MSAPKTAYRKYSQFLRQGTANIEHLIAKLQISDATHKQRFYLDGYMSAKLPDGTDGALGYVALGSANSNMHNLTARGGVIRGMAGGQVVQLLNDAGLNTRGIAVIDKVDYKWANNLGINATFNSAYYVDSTEFGIRHRKKGDASWNTEVVSHYLPKQGVRSLLNHIFSVYNPLETVQLQPYIINSEGEATMQITEIVVDDNVWSYGALKRPDFACSTINQEGTIVWFKESEYNRLSTVTEADANTGIFIYTDVTMSQLVSGSFFLYGLEGNKSFRVQSGEVRRYEMCTSSAPVVTLFYEAQIGGLYRFKARVSQVNNQDITVTARVDITPEVTANAKYISITIPSGQTEASEPIWRDLSDNTYHFYDANVLPVLELVVTPLM